MDKEYFAGYKMVQKTRNANNFMSAFIGSIGVKYRINKSTFPNSGDGPLAVFSNLLDAKAFFIKCSSSLSGDIYSLFKCNYVKSEYRELWLIDGRERVYNIVCVPPGTDYANEVVLLEKIK